MCAAACVLGVSHTHVSIHLSTSQGVQLVDLVRTVPSPVPALTMGIVRRTGVCASTGGLGRIALFNKVHYVQYICPYSTHGSTLPVHMYVPTNTYCIPVRTYVCMSIQYTLYVHYRYIHTYVLTVHTVCTLPVHMYVHTVHTVWTLTVHMYVLTAHTYCIIVHMSVQYIRNVSTYLFNIHM